MRVAVAFLAAGLLAGCGTSGGPLSAGVGGDVVEEPPVEHFRGPPVVQLTFLTGIEPSIETTFLLDYAEGGLQEGASDSDDLLLPDFTVARINMNAMIAKNVFYAVHMAKYLKLRADDDFVVILNPVTLNYADGRGYYYEPLEADMPPADIELNFLAYVHPQTAPSTRGDVLTTYGETLAPLVSVRMDPAFNPELGGAVALTDVVMGSALDPDGHGLRAQLADHLNVTKLGKTGQDLSQKAQPSGAFQPGMLFALEMETYTLEDEPPGEELLPESVMEEAKYEPGRFYVYEFYEGYYRIIMSALRYVDNRDVATRAQRDYWSFYESPDALETVMLDFSDRRKYVMLMKFKAAQLEFLEDRDDKWLMQVLETASFGESFKKLRDAEQEARDDYINAQIEAGFGILLGVLGVVATGYAASNDDAYGTVAGAALIGTGVGMVRRSLAEMEQVDTIFINSFQSSYETQKAYVIEAAEGDRIVVRADSWGEFRERLRVHYDERFAPNRNVAPTVGTRNAVPTS